MRDARPFGWLAASAAAVLASCTLIFDSSVLAVLPEGLPNAVEDSTYTQPLYVATDGARWELVEGALPLGLSLDAETGVISGRPATAGGYEFTVRATAGIRSGERAYSFAVLPRLRLDAGLESGRVGEPYSSAPTITGGVPPYRVDVVDLPAGMDVDADSGEVFGTPLIEDDWLIEFRVEDSGDPQQTTTGRTTLEIHPRGVSIVTAELPNAAVGSEYAASLEAENGRPPYSWRVVTGLLPNGLRLDRLSGEIAGEPTAQSRTSEFTVEVTDSDAPSTTATRELKIVVPVRIITDELADATVATSYESALGAVAGVPPYTWEVISGALPSGLSLDADTGLISGIPDAAGEKSFTIRVTDADTPETSDEQTLTLTVGT